MNRIQSILQRLTDKYEGVHSKIVRSLKTKIKRDPSLLDELVEDYASGMIKRISYQSASVERAHSLEVLSTPPPKQTKKVGKRIIQEQRASESRWRENMKDAVLDFRLASGVYVRSGTRKDLIGSIERVKKQHDGLGRRLAFEEMLLKSIPKGSDEIADAVTDKSIKALHETLMKI